MIKYDDVRTKPNTYDGDDGKLRLISDICVGYVNKKTVEGFKELVDEIKNIADKQLSIKK